tara:strand:+ start:188 stop:901 length:714 start_codon:yes stop_codon:yes gene_type:complete
MSKLFVDEMRGNTSTTISIPSGQTLNVAGNLSSTSGTISGTPSFPDGAKVNTIKHTGGTTGLTIDSSGRVLKSVIPRFSVYRGGSEQYINTSNMASVGVAIDWSTAEVNNGGANFDLSNNRFQAPATGTYRFDFSILTGLLVPSSGVNWGNFIFTKNGSTGTRIPGTPLTYFESYNASGTANAGVGGSGRHFFKCVGGGFAELTAGDTVQLMFQGSNSSNVRVHSGTHSIWSGYLIG